MEGQQQKQPLKLDWDSLIDDAPPAVLVVKPSSMDSDQALPPSVDGLDRLRDYELEDNIRRKKSLLETTGKNLPDGGAKLRAAVKAYEDELTRRKVNPRPQKVDEERKKPGQSTSSRAIGVSNDWRLENMSSQTQSQSSFASCVVKKIEDDMSHFKHCNNQTIRHNGESIGRRRSRESPQLSFQCPSKLSKCDTCIGEKICRANSALSVQTVKMKLSRHFPKEKDASQGIQSDSSRSRKGQPIVLDDDDDDDDEPHILEKTENKIPEDLKGAKIYFPSRDDPECIEICCDDLECLAPQGYLTSTIMNFYIRYLQQQASLANRPSSDYHFFNTYFYKKLKEAVSCKQSERETIFAKFRRWWKGVNIFQKAYVLIPIHEDLHWSLIIICIPDKEDESGPIILHLDSLGLHSSKLVFDNIKSFLIEERNYLGRECASSDVSIADQIWKCLARRIETQVIAVPQQKNDSDCGPFVLYFILRFMEEAPERLKKKDLAMFGKRWFKPEEASSLRVKIKELLVAELRNSIRHDSIIESSPSSAGTAIECVETAKVSYALVNSPMVPKERDADILLCANNN